MRTLCNLMTGGGFCDTMPRASQRAGTYSSMRLPGMPWPCWRRHGRPASIPTDHGSQLYADESKVGERGESEKKLAEAGIRQIPARVKPPPDPAASWSASTASSSARCAASRTWQDRRGLRPRLGGGPPGADPVARFVKNCNYRRPRMSPDWDNLETPYQAFQKNMPPIPP